MMYLNLIGAVAGVAFDEEGGGGGGETFAAEEFVAEEQPAWEETECSNEEGGVGEENPSYEINFNFPRPSIRPNSINNPLAAYLKPNRPPNRPTVPPSAQHYNSLVAASAQQPQGHLAPLTVGPLAHSSRPPSNPTAFPMQMPPVPPMQPSPAMTVTTTAMPVTWSTPTSTASTSARPSSGTISSTAHAPTMTITTTATPQYTTTMTTAPPLATGPQSQPTITHHHHYHHHHHPSPNPPQRMAMTTAPPVPPVGPTRTGPVRMPQRPVEPEFAISATTIAPSRRGRNRS